MILPVETWQLQRRWRGEPTVRDRRDTVTQDNLAEKLEAGEPDSAPTGVVAGLP